MKYLLSMICISSMSFYTQAEDMAVNSNIKAVTVYGDRASITRQAQIKLPSGQHILRFNNLPAALNANSIQFKANGATPATILDITAEQQARLTEINTRLQNIDQQLQEIDNELALIDEKQKVLKNQNDIINAMQNTVLVLNKEDTRPTAKDIKQIMDTTKIELTKISTALTALHEQKSGLETKKWDLRNEQSPLLRQQISYVKSVIVRLNLEQADTLTLDLTYIIPGASWHPSYDARFNTKDRKLSLNYQGVITQNTGEDWQDVKVTLSTAKPSLGGSAPQLNSWQIDEYKAPPPRPPVYQEAASSAQYSAIADELALKKQSYPAKMSAAIPMATVDFGATSASFIIEKTASLISGPNQQKVTITQLNLPSNLQYATVPRLQPTAYLQASTQNISNFPLISGQLNVFMDNRFITSGRLKTTMPKEAFKLDLGADDAISITYKQLSRFTENTGFTSSSEKVTYEYLISIQNNKATTESINLLDHIPISESEKIKVVLLKPTPKDAQLDKTGNITWKWQLAPGEKREANLKFSVEYPVNTKVIGLQ